MSIDLESGEINCGGYALGVNGWYEPYTLEQLQDLAVAFMDLKVPKESFYIGMTTLLSYKVWSDFPYTVSILNYPFEYPKPTEDLIALRVGCSNYGEVESASDLDIDFHFRLFGKENYWTEKNGNHEPTKVEGDIFDVWEGSSIIYDSPIIFFRKKNLKK